MPSEKIHEAVLSFCKLSVYKDYLYIIMNEGITVLPAHNDILIALAKTHFANTDFIYITHRINSYSVDPTTYLETSKIPNLKAFVVVDPKKNPINNSSVEKLFFNKPFGVFQTLEKAFEFKDKILGTEN